MPQHLLQDIKSCYKLSDEISAWVGKDTIVSRQSYSNARDYTYKVKVIVDRNKSYQEHKKQLEDWYKL